ncbi:MAG: transposase [Euryarchaeota archaeon]|nr:transposase [Euryarchaeota archaeon]
MKQSKFSPEQRSEIVVSLLGGRVSAAELRREHQITTTTLYRWREIFLEAALRGLQGEGPSQREAELERETTRLKETIGELAMANYALKKGASLSTGRKGGRV